MDGLIVVIVSIVSVLVFAAWFCGGIRKDQRSQLLDEVAYTGKLQDVEELAGKLGIVLVHDVGFSGRQKNLHRLVWPETLGKFTCSLLKAKENDPEFARYIQGIAVWLLDHYSYKKQYTFLQAMDRHPHIAKAISLALQTEQTERSSREETAWRQGVEERKRKMFSRVPEKKKGRWFKAWGVKPDTTPQDTTPQQHN